MFKCPEDRVPPGSRLLLGLALLLCATTSAASEQPAQKSLEPVVQRVRQLLRTEDSYAVAEYLEAEGDAKAVAQRYMQVMDALYWKQHDLPAALVVGRTGIQYCLRQARSCPEPQAAEFRSTGKSMAYNLASFTWPGWNEPGIRTTAAEEAAGLDAARLNLRLAVELKRGAKPLCNAHWILGAHQLAAGEFSAARSSFERAAGFARQDRNRASELMARGYGLLTHLLEGQNPDAEKELEVNAQALAREKDGAFFQEQLVTARKVFSGRFHR